MKYCDELEWLISSFDSVLIWINLKHCVMRLIFFFFSKIPSIRHRNVLQNLIILFILTQLKMNVRVINIECFKHTAMCLAFMSKTTTHSFFFHEINLLNFFWKLMEWSVLVISLIGYLYGLRNVAYIHTIQSLQFPLSQSSSSILKLLNSMGRPFLAELDPF